MRRVPWLIGVLAIVGLLQGGCTSSHLACSCAAGATFDGTFYQQYANTSVRPNASIGKSDKDAENCCGEPEPRVSIYSIEGIDPRIAIATRPANGHTYFNVATGLSERQQRVADRFAKKHHQLDSEQDE